LTEHRDWMRDRKARTRWLIEYGGLIAKAGVADQLEDDRATGPSQDWGCGGQLGILAFVLWPRVDAWLGC